MGKSMCKADKDKKLKVMGKQAKYKCKKCGAHAHKEKLLCKPDKL